MTATGWRILKNNFAVNVFGIAHVGERDRAAAILAMEDRVCGVRLAAHEHLGTECVTELRVPNPFSVPVPKIVHSPSVVHCVRHSAQFAMHVRLEQIIQPGCPAPFREVGVQVPVVRE